MLLLSLCFPDISVIIINAQYAVSMKRERNIKMKSTGLSLNDYIDATDGIIDTIWELRLKEEGSICLEGPYPPLHHRADP